MLPLLLLLVLLLPPSPPSLVYADILTFAAPADRLWPGETWTATAVLIAPAAGTYDVGIVSNAGRMLPTAMQAGAVVQPCTADMVCRADLAAGDPLTMTVTWVAGPLPPASGAYELAAWTRGAGNGDTAFAARPAARAVALPLVGAP